MTPLAASNASGASLRGSLIVSMRLCLSGQRRLESELRLFLDSEPMRSKLASHELAALLHLQRSLRTQVARLQASISELTVL